MLSRRLITFLSILVLACGCDDDSLQSEAEVPTIKWSKTPTPYDDRIAAVTVHWDECEDVWAFGQCATSRVPLFWDGSRAGEIEIAALRRTYNDPPHAAQVWFVDGGPGFAGTKSLPWLLDEFLLQNQSLEVFTLDHRGTGDSSYLSCGAPGVSDEECVEALEDSYGEDLWAYSTTNAAIDLAALIEQSRRDGVPVFVVGSSYGTYLVHRYLQIFPDWVDGVILDSISPPGDTFADFTEYTDQAGADLFGLCADDNFCAAKLGDDPYLRVAQTLQNVADGHCSALGDEYDHDFILGLTFRMLYMRPLNELLPALFYRLERCSADDVQVWRSLVETLRQVGIVDPDYGEEFSRVLYQNIVYSEMWGLPLGSSADDLEQFIIQADSQATMRSSGLLEMHEVSLFWPVYEDVMYDDKWAVTDIPLLMLQGQLDPATPWVQAVEMGEKFQGAAQHFVTFPNAPHGALANTPVSHSATHCGLDLAVSFIGDPTGQLDTSCVAEVDPLDFEGVTFDTHYLLGTSDLWGDGSVQPTALLPDAARITRSPNAVQRAIERLRRQVAPLNQSGGFSDR